jgi:hypothetical protein
VNLPSLTRQRLINIGLIAAFVVLSAITVWNIYAERRDAEQAELAAKAEADQEAERAARLEEQLAAGELDRETLRGLIGELQEQVRRRGGVPVVRPGEVPGSPAESVETAVDAAVVDYFQRFPVRVPGVSQAALEGAVADYLLTNPPQRGSRGAPGRPPSDGEIAAAVAAALAADPPPAGPPGADGADGAPGPEGAPGDQGSPGPAGERGQQGERGPAGVDGAPGATGPPGPAGGPGVVAVAVDPVCTSGDGYLASINQTYDPATQTITVSCTRSTAGLTPVVPPGP